MMKVTFESFFKALAGMVLGLAVLMQVTPLKAQESDPENTLVLALESGEVLIEMFPDVAPGHVERIKALAREGFYDGIVFHRVIEGFMAQTGDPTGTGRGSSDLPDLKAEFSDKPFLRGTVGMARTRDPDSANSQWFVTFAPARHLDGQYTVWGRVIDGMEYIDALKKAPPGSSTGMVPDPDKIVSLRVRADTQ